jgi:hypothetical protein
MLFSLRSIARSSARIASSVLVCGPVAAVRPGAEPADPVVTPGPEFTPEPEELAVPALLVPGAGSAAAFAEFSAPLGSLPELFRPPALAGPDGTPLTADVPAPAEPAAGVPVALPPAPPAPCANEVTGDTKIAIAASAGITDAFALHIGILLSYPNGRARNRFRGGTISAGRD